MDMNLNGSLGGVYISQFKFLFTREWGPAALSKKLKVCHLSLSSHYSLLEVQQVFMITLIYDMSACMEVTVHAINICDGQKTTCRRRFLPSTMWVLGIELSCSNVTLLSSGINIPMSPPGHLLVLSLVFLSWHYRFPKLPTSFVTFTSSCDQQKKVGANA